MLSLVKHVLDSTGPGLVAIINNSLASDCIPAYIKQTIVQILLRKINLDTFHPKNHRSISKLPFLKLIVKQLLYVLEAHCTHNFSLGLSQKHCTEIALLRVSNYI